MGRCVQGLSDWPGLSSWLVGNSTSTLPTLYGPVYRGKVGVGFILSKKVIVGIGALRGRRESIDLESCESDSVALVFQEDEYRGNKI